MGKIQKTFCLSMVLMTGLSLDAFAQDKVITGTVKDAKDVIIGASVKVDGSKVGTVTDMDGNFKLKVPANAKKLTITYVGYDPQTIELDGKNSFNVTLSESSQMLDEVVAIGYAKVKRRDLTAATSSVNGDQLAIAPVTTAAQALTGKAAGVSVITSNGAPGADINITVRGGTSLTQSSSPLYIVDGFVMDNGLQNVDINDIASIDVMKDASATAIYGSAGANGVVIITTKSGKAGKTEINYNGYLSFEQLGKKLNVLNITDYVKYQYEFQALAGDQDKWVNMFGGSAGADAYKYIDQEYSNREGIDWQDLVFGKTALTQNHNLNISGGSEKTKYMVSYNLVDQDGIMDKHGYRRNSLRVKVNHTLYDHIRFDFNSFFTDTRVEGGGAYDGLKNAILQPVTGGVRFTNDQFINADLLDEMQEIDSQYDIANPIINNDAVTDIKKTRMFVANAGLEFDFLKDFMFRTAGSYSWSQTRVDKWDDGRTKTAQNLGGPYGSRNNSEKFRWQITNTLSWGHKYGDHKVNVLLGQETLYSQSIGLENEYTKFPDINFGLNNVNMGTASTWSSSKSRSGKVSFFSRVSYNYQERYLFNATVRGDGSSKFARGHQWGAFPSASAAWRISEEKFMKNQNIFSNLKLRLGYGVAGNDAIDNNMYATDYGAGHVIVNKQDISSLVPGDVIGNKDLRWEKTSTTNIGLDMSFLNGRLNLSVDWYNNKSDNLLVKNSIPTSTGYTYQYQNVGAIRNRGMEFVWNSLNIKGKDFKWTTDLNISFNRSKVLALYGNSDSNYWLRSVSSGHINYWIQEGQPLGQFYGYKYAGVYTTDDFVQQADGSYKLKDGVPSAKGTSRSSIKPGDVKYICIAGETDKDGNPVWSTNDRTVIGNATPKFQGGFNNTFAYKGFDLNIFMNFSVGNKLFNMSTQRFMGPYLPNQNTLTVMKDRFKLVDPNTGKETTDLKRLAELNPQQYDSKAMWSLHSSNKNTITDPVDYFLEDGSYLRLSTITLGYTFPKKWMSRLHISNMRLYCTLNNICTITGYSGYDPEVASSSSLLEMGLDNASYPRSKSYVVGLNINF